MNDEKRQLRKLKREIKKTGNRKRRRFLKDVDAEPEQFTFGLDRSDVMNEPRREEASRSEDETPGGG